MSNRSAPDLRRTPHVIRLFETRLTQLPQDAIDHAHCEESVRHPYHVDVECKAAARVSDTTVAPTSRMTPAVRIALEAHEVRGILLARVRRRRSRHIREILAQCAAPARDEALFAGVRHTRVREIPACYDGQLKVVIDHPVVLSRGLKVFQERGVAGLEEFRAVLPNRLAAERFFVTRLFF